MKLKKAKYSALEVAYYIINYGYKNNIVISNLRLQSILYYAQLKFLKHSKLCFNEDIIINSNGPIVKLVNEKFKRYGALIIPPVKYYYDLSKGFLHMRKVPYKCKIDKKDRLILINVILKCCSCSTSELIQRSSISASKISMYYRSNNISGENLFKFFSKNNNWR